MKTHNQGMILLTTLLMISWIALMVMSVMRSALLLSQVNQQRGRSHRLFYAMEDASHALIHTKSSTFSSCQLRPCSFEQKGVIYQYQSRDLGFFPCLRLLSKEGTISSHHWVIRVSSPQQSDALLRLRVAIKGNLTPCTQPPEKILATGVISWQYWAYNPPAEEKFGV